MSIKDYTIKSNWLTPELYKKIKRLCRMYSFQESDSSYIPKRPTLEIKILQGGDVIVTPTPKIESILPTKRKRKAKFMNYSSNQITIKMRGTEYEIHLNSSKQ